jgi:UDP-N-acetyl-D-glucosamine dehydrogenase
MAKHMKEFELKIKNKKAKIAVIGLGYVGLPLAHAFAQKGFHVTGMDVDSTKTAQIMQGKCYIADIETASLRSMVKKGLLRAVSRFDALQEMDAVIVCVPTPLNRVKDPDISYIVSAVEQIKKHLHPGMLVSLESTTYPGTTDEVILPMLEKSGLKAGEDFFLCFSPERIDPGNAQFKTENIPKVVGGTTAACGALGALFYGQITTQAVKVSSTRTAEMAKLLENTFRIVNIGLVNELARAAENLKVNIWEAIDAAKTKPFGYMAFYPGPGIGGHCIGIDPLYLSWKARIHGSDLHFIELARRVNAEMPHYVVTQSVYALNKHLGKAISRSRVLVLGAAYKRDVSDMRESPALEIMEHLKRLGAAVCYHDPYVPEVRTDHLKMRSVSLTAKVLKKQDLVILVTDHSKFDYKMTVRNCRLIFDTRNRLKDFREPNIVRF